MDYTLRCNSLKCRLQLTERAVVTTCSHIFCIPCSDTLGLSQPSGGARSCPACQTALTNPDDAVVTQLNPTEDYKTSVLSGLSPGVIMECAGRALSFYSYQATQEILYQEYLANSLTDKYAHLNSQMDKVIHEANAEIMNLRDKLTSAHTACKTLEQKNQELTDQYLNKSRAHAQTQKMYQNLKAQVMASHVATAASDNAEHVLQTATAPRFADHPGTSGGRYTSAATVDPKLHGRQRSWGTNRDTASARAVHPAVGNIWSSHGLRGFPSNPTLTPSHRQQLPPTNSQSQGYADRYGFAREQDGPVGRTTMAGNAFSGGMSGYGMGPGVRVGRRTTGSGGNASPPSATIPLDGPSGMMR